MEQLFCWGKYGIFFFFNTTFSRLFSRTSSQEFSVFNPCFLLLSTFLHNSGEGGGEAVMKGLTIGLLLTQFNNFRPLLQPVKLATFS